jgi:tetratricopeptide (TPR) repeat protein
LFKRNVEANPNSANAYDSLADSYEKSERWKEATAAAERAAALATQFALPNRQVFIEQAKKRQEKSRQYFKTPQRLTQ